MKKNIEKLFEPFSLPTKPLFILEMANNHMGDLKHGLKIIRSFHKVSKKFDFDFAFKFQYRDIADTFIHPDYKDRLDIKYVKRFSETALKPNEFLKLKNEAEKLGFITICTPFDEKSVDLIKKHNYSIIKIASCSFNDWPLLEKVVKTNKPIIVSTGGAELDEVDKVVSFLSHRKKTFSIMHCVGEYPTIEKNLQLNQINLFKERYLNIPIGFSTHEEPNNFLPIQIAIAKGAQIFERHVGIRTDKYELNSYSSTPEQLENWLKSAQKSLVMGGVIGERAGHSDKELSDIRQFQRGVFVKKAVKKGDVIDMKNIFFAFPNQPGQLLANNISKYKSFYAKKDIDLNGPVVDFTVIDNRKRVYEIVKKIDRFLKKANVVFPSQVDLEISHHYGLDRFNEIGMCMITCVNRDYCKKLLVVFPGQFHPVQYHRRKEETFHILHGKFIVILNKKEQVFNPGDILTIKPNVKHSFSAPNGGILEEISSTHFKNDSFYIDKKIMENKNRKTFVSYWRDIK